MNPVAILNTQFIQVALPIMVTLVLAAWLTNNSSGKRIDDLRGDMKELKSEMNRRFDRVEALLSDHGERIVKLEERTSPLTRR